MNPTRATLMYIFVNEYSLSHFYGKARGCVIEFERRSHFSLLLLKSRMTKIILRVSLNLWNTKFNLQLDEDDKDDIYSLNETHYKSLIIWRFWDELHVSIKKTWQNPMTLFQIDFLLMVGFHSAEYVFDYAYGYE